MSGLWKRRFRIVTDGNDFCLQYRRVIFPFWMFYKEIYGTQIYTPKHHSKESMTNLMNDLIKQNEPKRWRVVE
jgi:hypothetical protein